jgi:hypothetical protein
MLVMPAMTFLSCFPAVVMCFSPAFDFRTRSQRFRRGQSLTCGMPPTYPYHAELCGSRRPGYLYQNHRPSGLEA